MSFNKIILVGNLGRDPELRYTPQGTPVCSFSMATNERRKDKAGDFQDVTTWFRVTLWGRQAETAQQYLTKGRPVYIEGRLRVEEYTDKEGKPFKVYRAAALKKFKDRVIAAKASMENLQTGSVTTIEVLQLEEAQLGDEAVTERALERG